MWAELCVSWPWNCKDSSVWIPLIIQPCLCCTGVQTWLMKTVHHSQLFMHLGYIPCPSDSQCHFLIMVWLPASFPFVFTFIMKGNQVTSAITKSQRQNNIDWRPRGLWITYWGRFIPAALSWRTQTPACCPVCAEKIMAFLSIWETYFVSLEHWVILHCKGKWKYF